MKSHIVVIGGGFAGAAAASALAETGLSVTLLEQRVVLGGRASSLRDGVTREEVDNGQHVFLGCYRETRRFLRRLRVEDRLTFLPSLRIPFVSPGGRRRTLRCPALPGSLGVLAGLLAFGELSLRDRWALLRGLAAFRLSRKDLSQLTVSEWLDRLRQTPGARRAFWTPVCLATLNERPEAACAEALAVVLREGFLGSAEDRALGYANVSFAKLWPVELSSYLKRQGGLVASRQTAVSLRVEGRRVRAVAMENGDSVEADAVVAAVPPPAFLQICPPELRSHYRELESLSYSAIASVNFWFPRPLFEDPLVGLLDTDVQWAFNRHRLWASGGASPGYVSLVLSGASAYGKMTSEDILAMAMKDLRRCFPGLPDPVHGTVVWEKQATPSPTPANWRRRPPVATPLENLFLAGDWVDAGLPATIEAACRSGHRAASLAQTCLEKEEKNPDYVTAPRG